MLGRKCANCGFSDTRALQIDHVNGDGAKERKTLKSGYMRFSHILKVSGKGYQTLCANCNWIKRYENKEYLKNRKNGRLS